MSYHQIMPRFLDHVSTFCLRSDPLLETSFRSEDYLDHTSKDFKLDFLGRSGFVMQHCFNLIGMEYNRSQDEDWPYFFRQTAAYYSFDPAQGSSVWLILKANAVIRDRIYNPQGHPGHRFLSDLGTPEQALTAALYAHLVIVEWCNENWVSYIDFLETAIKSPSAMVKLSQVARETTGEKLKRRETLRSQRQGSDLKHQSEKGMRSRICRVLRAPSGISSALMQNNQGVDGDLRAQNDEIDLDKTFSFDKLQKFHRYASKMEDARLAIQANKIVLLELLQRFKDLKQSESFCIHIKTDQVGFAAFFKRTEWCICELDRRHAKLSTMLVDLEKVISLFDSTLQYRNMKTSEFFAQNAKDTTDLMHEIAKKTKRETSSMHVITGLTLVFLPGTFVAVRRCLFCRRELVSLALTRCQTLFSSGIVNFDGNKPRRNWGAWEIRWSALWLFLAVSLPLMGFVLAFWAVISYWTKNESLTSQRARQLDASGKGTVEETV
ncbi:hypothetical protein F5Y19DRAFT_415881 [Xylariaceae sp. FL1651]|nr:hypothetical protein F5Y19DRAFT_415881 [Xylariaceae sp. FL1651]